LLLAEYLVLPAMHVFLSEKNLVPVVVPQMINLFAIVVNFVKSEVVRLNEV
jgi:hypothetical protein